MRRRAVQPALERCEGRLLLATIIEVPRIAGTGAAVAAAVPVRSPNELFPMPRAELTRWSPAIGTPNPVGPNARAAIGPNAHFPIPPFARAAIPTPFPF